jgi:hypothetical protein
MADDLDIDDDDLNDLLGLGSDDDDDILGPNKNKKSNTCQYCLTCEMHSGH